METEIHRGIFDASHEFSHTMGFEVVEKKNSRKVSIRKDGSIMLPEKTIEAYFDDAAAVQILIDEENGEIAFKEAAADSRHSYKIPDDESMEIRGHGVFHSYDVDIDQTARYLGVWDSDDEFLVVDLEQPYTIYDSADESDESESEDASDAKPESSADPESSASSTASSGAIEASED
ncbi:hypothetical protein [Halorientalis persicus]|nr:hypothetical protein [Halorientalis persicus]